MLAHRSTSSRCCTCINVLQVRVNGIRCTPAYKLQDCANTHEDDEVEQYSDNSDSDTK